MVGLSEGLPPNQPLFTEPRDEFHLFMSSVARCTLCNVFRPRGFQWIVGLGDDCCVFAWWWKIKDITVLPPGKMKMSPKYGPFFWKERIVLLTVTYHSWAALTVSFSVSRDGDEPSQWEETGILGSRKREMFVCRVRYSPTRSRIWMRLGWTGYGWLFFTETHHMYIVVDERMQKSVQQTNVSYFWIRL